MIPIAHALLWTAVVTIITREDMALFPSAKALFPSAEEETHEAAAGKYMCILCSHREI